MKGGKDFRLILADLGRRPPVNVGGETYTGVRLAQLVAIDLEHADEAMAETPQMVVELGREVAAALYAVNRTDAEYRIWRDGVIHAVTNDVAEAARAGFECAANPGVDAKGVAREAKTPSAAAADLWKRTLPEYLEWQERIARASEAYQTLLAAFEAAKLRERALQALLRSGGTVAPERRAGPVGGYTPAPEPIVEGSADDPVIERIADEDDDAVRVPALDPDALREQARQKREQFAGGGAGQGRPPAGPPARPALPPLPGGRSA